MSNIVPDVLHVVLLTHEPGVSLVPSQLAGRVVCHVVSLQAREEIRAQVAAIDPDVVIVDTHSSSDARVVDDLLHTWPNLPLLIVDREQPPHDWSPFVTRGVEDVLTRQTMTAEQIERAIHHAVLRRRRSSVLRESESRFRALAESSPTAIYIEQDQRAVYANPAAAALTGVPLDALIGRDPLSFVHPDWREPLDERRRLRLAGHDVPSRYEVKMLGPEGQDRWLDVTAAAILYRGRPALLVNAIDITDRKRLEEQLMLRARLDAVGRLAGGIAHDFNNLLQVVHGHVERLQEAISPSHPLHDSVIAISGAAARATTLTEQLLAVGRRQMLLPKSVDLNELVSRFSSAMLGTLPTHIRLRVNQAADLPPVRIDEARLEQALSHLVSNACEAMPDGGELTIVTKLVNVNDQELKPRLRSERTSAQPGAYVAVEVLDTGRGMTPDVMAQAFDPFFSTKPNAPGAGLGLPTVYGIVKQSGGYITGESTPGQGTCWSIWLPPAIAPVSAASSTQLAPDTLRILLVEDEPAVRSLLYETLTRDGLNVVAFGSAEEALESWVDNSFDILITDVGLPGLTGPELAKELLARAPDLRVVFISGYVADSLGSSGIDPNAVFLQKPFNPRELAKRVRQVAAHPVTTKPNP